MAKLDTSMIWITWGCPACNQVIKQWIREVGFSMEIDTECTVDGTVDTWIETTCPACGTEFEKKLSKI